MFIKSLSVSLKISLSIDLTLFMTFVFAMKNEGSVKKSVNYIVLPHSLFVTEILSWMEYQAKLNEKYTLTTQKESVFGVVLVHSLPGFSRIRTEYGEIRKSLYSELFWSVFFPYFPVVELNTVSSFEGASYNKIQITVFRFRSAFTSTDIIFQIFSTSFNTI